MKENVTYVVTTVDVPAALAGAAAITIPAGASDLRITPPTGTIATFEWRIFALDGVATGSTTSRPTSGTEPFVLRPGSSVPIAQAVGIDCANSMGVITCQVEYCI